MIINYPGIGKTIEYLFLQARKDIKWAKRNIPRLFNAASVFAYLKSNTTYKNDKFAVEQLQKLSTLLGTNNIHGIKGAGDCDCFTIASLTLLAANNITCGIVLAGRTKGKNPSHIWAFAIENNAIKNLDLTEKTYNATRYYPLRQYILFYKAI